MARAAPSGSGGVEHAAPEKMTAAKKSTTNQVIWIPRI
jgi:hypothetical protein